MTAKPSLTRVVAPSHRKHVTGSLDHDRLVPTFSGFIDGNHEVAWPDVTPALRQNRFAILCGPSRGRGRCGDRHLSRLGGRVRRCYKLGVQVATDVRHEPAAVGVDPASRKTPGQV